jgi:hypothetical protein
MLKDHKFWAGVVAGIILYVLYTKFAAKKLGGSTP